MSGLINWRDDPAPIYKENNPPLFYYLIALFSCAFGTNEIPLHLLLSIFTFLSLYYFFKIAQILSLKNVNILLVLFAFCPAFIVNQNLMLDIPVLAVILGSAYFLIKANHSSKIINYILAALFLSVGLLIKYSIIPLFAVLSLVILIRQEYKKLLVLIIPLFVLILWSLWNYIEYGSIHIMTKSAGIIHIKQLWAFIACLGSISAFVPSFISGSYPVRILKNVIYGLLTLFVIAVILFIFDLVPERQFSEYLNSLFIINGFIVLILLFNKFVFDLIIKGLRIFITTDDFLLFLYISSISAFMVIFAPNIATRHVLLVIPFILLFGHELIDKANISINRLSLTIAILLGLFLGISDWKYSDYYRQMASAIDLPKDRNIWTAGHWGWQWYSKKNGMKQYNTHQSNVIEGDYFVYPGNISRQKINKSIHLTVLKKKWQEASFLTFLSGNNFASMYNSTIEKPSWCLSKDPIDTIYICKVQRIISQ